MRTPDLEDKKFGRLTVLLPVGSLKGKKYWLCKCDCGEEICVNTNSLTSGKTKSCGCYAKERAIESNIKHGKRHTRLYNIYCGMKTRCYNTNNYKLKNYGERGIKICDDWLNDFMSFYNWALENGYTETLTIERIDVNGDYEPSNCKWIEMGEQSKNKTCNRVIEYQGITKILSEWCKELGLNYKKVHSRLCYGCPVENAFSKSDLRRHN